MHSYISASLLSIYVWVLILHTYPYLIVFFHCPHLPSSFALSVISFFPILLLTHSSTCFSSIQLQVRSNHSHNRTTFSMKIIENASILFQPLCPPVYRSLLNVQQVSHLVFFLFFVLFFYLSFSFISLTDHSSSESSDMHWATAVELYSTHRSYCCCCCCTIHIFYNAYFSCFCFC